MTCRVNCDEITLSRMDNLKELYAYSKEQFNREYDRFKNVEGKAAQYLSALTLLIGAAGFFLKWVVDSFVPPRNLFEWALVVLAGLVLGTLLVAWFFTFKVLKVFTIVTPPLNEAMIDFFVDENLPYIYYRVAKQQSEDLKQNRTECNRKVSALGTAYKLICGSVLFLVLFLSAYVAYNWKINPTREKNVPNQNNDGGNSKPPNNPTSGNNPKPSSDRPFPASEKVENGGKVPEIRDPKDSVPFKT